MKDTQGLPAINRAVGKIMAVPTIYSVGGDLVKNLSDLLAIDGELVVFGTATGAPRHCHLAH